MTLLKFRLLVGTPPLGLLLATVAATRYAPTLALPLAIASVIAVSVAWTLAPLENRFKTDTGR